MNTIAASTRRVPRAAVIGLVALVAAFVALMLVRSGILGGSEPAAVPSLAKPAPTPQATTPAKPKIVLLPGLPGAVASKLHYSRIVVVSLYSGRSAGDRAAVAEARAGARAAGAGFVAINVGDDRAAKGMSSFAGPVSSPSMLVVKRPGKIVTRMEGTVDTTVVSQAAHNAGARR